ncbi:MAG: hypothetical protein U5R48_16650 [Gammaproteobacteria bacterium]|nr:hypothetical protein [Gammaproteobacteria bacterium]
MSRLSGSTRIEEDDRSERTRDFSGLFDPSTHLCGLVEDTLQGSRAVRLRLADQGEILICPQRRRYHDLSSNIAAVHASPREPFRVEALSTGGSAAAGSPNRQAGAPWTNCSGARPCMRAPGRLTLGISMTDVLQLTRWPNLPRVPRTPNTARIAALLSCQPVLADRHPRSPEGSARRDRPGPQCRTGRRLSALRQPSGVDSPAAGDRELVADRTPAAQAVGPDGGR